MGKKNLSLTVKYVLITLWCPANKLEWYKAIILSTHVSGIAYTAVSLSGVVDILNNNESNMYFSANVSTFLIPTLELGNLLWAKYKYISLKCKLFKYLPEFLLSLPINVNLLILYIELFLIFYLYLLAFVKILYKITCIY